MGAEAGGPARPRSAPPAVADDDRTTGVPLTWPPPGGVVAPGIAATVVLVGALALGRPLLVVAAPLVAAAVVLVGAQRTGGAARGGLQIDQIERLRRAEVALAEAATTEGAARELADHALALLGARAAVVLIEGIGDTVRVAVGEGSVYGDGSRMRLLDDAGVPCGSIAVSARADGKPYTAAQERMLDALAQRVSSTLHRLSLFAEVQSERRTLADVLGSSSDGIFAVGMDLAVQSWNPAMERITGTSAAQAVGMPVADVFRPAGEDGRPRHGAADPGRTGEPVAGLVRIGEDADARWLHCSWSPLSEGGYVVVARDETERKNLQDDKDGWIAQVSHELRTPLTPIKGFLHTLQRRDASFSDEDRQRIYDVMLREEQRLEDLVDGLLRATSLDRDEVMVVPEELDWAGVVEEQVDQQRRTDPACTIEVTAPEALPAVVADPVLSGAVLAQLLSNAVKYSPDGGVVRVAISTAGDQVVTEVTDEGPGVPQGDRERIFDKFTRLGDHLTRAQQGVGLGLYIARRSAQAMGGTLGCVDGPGPGATFRLALPGRRVQLSAQREPAEQPRRRGGSPLRA
jgi:PAS domain S-box-containing protein